MRPNFMLYRGFFFHSTGFAIRFEGDKIIPDEPQAGFSEEFSDGTEPEVPPFAPWTPTDSDVPLAGYYLKDAIDEEYGHSKFPFVKNSSPSQVNCYLRDH